MKGTVGVGVVVVAHALLWTMALSKGAHLSASASRADVRAMADEVMLLRSSNRAAAIAIQPGLVLLQEGSRQDQGDGVMHTPWLSREPYPKTGQRSEGGSKNRDKDVQNRKGGSEVSDGQENWWEKMDDNSHNDDKTVTVDTTDNTYDPNKGSIDHHHWAATGVIRQKQQARDDATSDDITNSHLDSRTDPLEKEEPPQLSFSGTQSVDGNWQPGAYTKVGFEKVDCLVGAWGAPGDCSAQCGGGLRTYRRIVLRTAGGSGKKCPPLIKASKCNIQACGTEPKEVARKTAEKMDRLDQDQSRQRKSEYLHSEVKVMKSQNAAMKALKEALPDGKDGLKSSNNEKYVKLVDAVSTELKTYDEDKKTRESLIEQQVHEKQELFAKRITDSVHEMKYGLMEKADTFEHNPWYQDKGLDAQNHVAAAKETTTKQQLVQKYREFKAKQAAKEKLANNKEVNDEKLVKRGMGVDEPLTRLDLGEAADSKVATVNNVFMLESTQCRSCMQSCKTEKCGNWCHEHFCNEADRPSEYLASWEGVDLGSTSSQLSDDKFAPTSEQHHKNKVAVEDEVLNRVHNVDPDKVDSEQHQKNEIKTAVEIRDRNTERTAEQLQIEEQKEWHKERQVAEKHQALMLDMMSKEFKKEAEKRKIEQRKVDVQTELDDKLIELELRRDDAKARKKKAAEETFNNTTGVSKDDLQQLRNEEADAKDAVDEQTEKLGRLAVLDGAKKMMVSKIQASKREVDELTLQKVLLEAKKAKLVSDTEARKADAEADHMHAVITTEHASKLKEKEAIYKEQEHKGSSLTKMERSKKAATKHYQRTLSNMQMQLSAAKFAAEEASQKLKASTKIEELANRVKAVEKNTTKLDEETAKVASTAGATSAMNELEKARDVAYQAQRNAAIVANKIASAPTTPAGSIIVQGHADLDAAHARDHYFAVKAQLQDTIKNMPTALGPEAEMATVEKEGEAAKEKAKKAADKFFKEKELCRKLEKETEIACAPPEKPKQTSYLGEANEAAAADSEEESKDEGSDDKKSQSTNSTSDDDGNAKKTPQEDAGKGEGSGKGKGSGKGETPANGKGKGEDKRAGKVCNLAAKKFREACNNIKKAEAEAALDEEQALRQAAYKAQMKAAQVALQESKGEASPTDVATADAAAERAVKKADKPPPLKDAKDGKTFSEAQVKKLVVAEVQKVLGKGKGESSKDEGKTPEGKQTKKDQAKGKLDKEVDEDVKKMEGKSEEDESKGQSDRVKEAKKKAKEEGQKANAKDKAAHEASKQKQSKEGEVKEAAKKVVRKHVKKGAILLKTAFNAQLRAAEMEKMRVENSANKKQVDQADQAAETAKQAWEDQAVLTGWVIQCQEGHGKLLNLEKQLAEVDPTNTVLKENIENQMIQLTKEIHRACEKEKSSSQKSKNAEEKAKVQNEAMKKLVKQTEDKKEQKDKEEKAKEDKKEKEVGKDQAATAAVSDAIKSSPDKAFEVIVEHGAITAKLMTENVQPTEGPIMPASNITAVDTEKPQNASDVTAVDTEQPRNASDYKTIVTSNGTITGDISAMNETDRIAAEITKSEMKRVQGLTEGHNEVVTEKELEAVEKFANLTRGNKTSSMQNVSAAQNATAAQNTTAAQNVTAKNNTGGEFTHITLDPELELILSTTARQELQNASEVPNLVSEVDHSSSSVNVAENIVQKFMNRTEDTKAKAEIQNLTAKFESITDIPTSAPTALPTDAPTVPSNSTT